MAEIKTLGPVGLNPLGDYNSETEYEKLDVVLYQGSSYVAVKESIGQLPINTEYWEKLVSGGVGVDDIVDNLDSNETAKPLSAKQGKELNKTKATIYNTVADMKAANLKVGMAVQTLGYYSVNDGGGATYKITSEESQTDFQEELVSGLYASLIIENNTINIKQLGARPQDKANNKYDLAPYLEKYISFINVIPNRCKLYIPSGVWYCSPFNLDCPKGFDIEGDVGFCLSEVDGTLIISLEDNQDYILQIGNNTRQTNNWSLKNIIFSTTDCEYREGNNLNCFVFTNNIKTIANQCLNLLYASFGFTDNLLFINIKGQAFKMTSCWENYFNLINFRRISNHQGSIMNFGEVDKTLNPNANITACYFEKIMFECVHGNLINFEHNCAFSNNHFGVINFEDYILNMNGEVYTTFTDDILQTFDDETAIHYSIINVALGGSINSCVIDSIEMNNVSFRYHEYDNNIYVYDTLIKVESYSKLGLYINHITNVGMNKDMRLLYKPNDYAIKNDSELLIGSINNPNQKNFYFDVKGFSMVKCESSLKGFQQEEVNSDDFIPFYKSYYRRELKPLFYDKDCNNKLNLCVQANTSNFIKFTIGNNNIFIRAKIPNNETCKLSLVNDTGSAFYTMEMLGTGNFENYTFDISTKFNIGDIVNCRLSSQNTATSCYLDYYKFY